MSYRRISDRFAEWIEEKLEAIDDGDGISWDGEMIVANQEGAAAFMLHVFMPAPVMGESFHIFVPVHIPNMQTKEHVQGIIMGMVETMRGQRSQMLGQSNGQAQPGQSLIDPRKPPGA